MKNFLPRMNILFHKDIVPGAQQAMENLFLPGNIRQQACRSGKRSIARKIGRGNNVLSRFLSGPKLPYEVMREFFLFSKPSAVLFVR